MGITPSQLNPNGWRIIVAMQLLWRKFSEGNFQLTMDEFLFYYKSIKIPKLPGFFQFSPRYRTFKLIMSLSLFDRKWKSEFFFMYGFWIGDPIEVGRNTFPLLDCVRDRPRPEGMHFFFLCICMHIISSSGTLSFSFLAFVRLVLDNFFEARVHRASLFTKNIFVLW